MALSEQRQLQEINHIAEALSSCERRRLLYLCGSLDTDHSEACVKEILKSKVLRQDRGQLFLKELMVQLRRFDILRKVYKTSRDEVERTLMYRECLPRFRVLMANISEDMGNGDVDSVKFLLSTTLPRDKLENATNFLDVIMELEKQDKVSPERVDFVEECLMNISRVDLARKVITYKTSVAASENSPQRQRCRLPPSLGASNSSHAVQQIRQEQSLRSAPKSLPVNVYREQNSQSELERYKFNSNPRGICVIIDCVGNEGGMLEETFKALHFNVLLYKWLTVDDTLSALRDALRCRENLQGDGFVCCIISRGTTNHVLGTDLYVTGLHLDNIRRLFSAEFCPMLAGKPKVFFIQRYSVPENQPAASIQHQDEDLETDGISRCEVIPSDADVFWSHFWTDERQLEQGDHRSVYLKALTEALLKGQRSKRHIVDIHTEVNGAIFRHNQRNPAAKYHFDLKHTLRKDLYLH